MSLFRRNKLPVYFRDRWKGIYGGGWLADPVNQEMVRSWWLFGVFLCLIGISGEAAAILCLTTTISRASLLELKNAMPITFVCLMLLLVLVRVAVPRERFSKEFEALRLSLRWHNEAMQSAKFQDFQAAAMRILKWQAASVKEAQALDPVGNYQQIEKDKFRQQHQQFVFWGFIAKDVDWKVFFEN